MQVLNVWFEADIFGCLRCGEHHKSIRFERTKNIEIGDPYINEFFAICPNTKHPIIITINSDEVLDIGIIRCAQR